MNSENLGKAILLLQRYEWLKINEQQCHTCPTGVVSKSQTSHPIRILSMDMYRSYWGYIWAITFLHIWVIRALYLLVVSFIVVLFGLASSTQFEPNVSFFYHVAFFLGTLLYLLWTHLSLNSLALLYQITIISFLYRYQSRCFKIYLNV